MSIARFGLYDRNREIRIIPEQIIGPFLLAAAGLSTNEHDTTVRKTLLFIDGMGAIVPTGCLQLGDDELPASIGLIHTRTSSPNYHRPSHGQWLVKETGLS